MANEDKNKECCKCGSAECRGVTLHEVCEDCLVEAPKTQRKIIQIAISSGQQSNSPDWVYALANDGTLWIAETNTHEMKWDQLSQLPQE